MVLLNEHVILEITRYLAIPDLLSLALSSRMAFHVSQLYSFWRPHELDAFSGFSAFLPTERIGPWRGYSGDDIRLAAMKMRGCRDNWQSEQPIAKYRVSITAKEGILLGIPGTRWLYSFQQYSSSLQVQFADGRTGHRTAKGIDIVPPGTIVGDESPAIFSLEPDKILIGDSGENDDETWDFALFRVNFFFEENDGTLELKFHQTQVNLWKNVPRSPMATANSQFLVLSSDYADPTHGQIRIYDLNSSRSCAIREVENHDAGFLRDDWYIMAIDRSNEVHLVAVHLPSVLTSNQTIEWLELPEGLGTPIGSVYDDSSIKFSSSIDNFYNRAEYSVLLYTSEAHFTFDIRVEVAVDSIYGQINLVGQRSRISTETELQRDIPHDPLKVDEKYLLHHPIQLSPSCRGPSGLLAGYGTGNVLGTLYVADLRQSMPLRRVDWRASIRYHMNANSEDPEATSGTEPMRWIPYWDPQAGVLLLREAQRLEPGIVYQICWF